MGLLRTLLIATLLVGCALMAHGQRRQSKQRQDPTRRGPLPVCGFVLEGVEDETGDCPSDGSCSVDIDFTIDGVAAHLSFCKNDDVNDDERKAPYGLCRSACFVTNNTLEVKKRDCLNGAACSRGPVEITVDGDHLTAMFCDGDSTWFSIFSSPPNRIGSGNGRRAKESKQGRGGRGPGNADRQRQGRPGQGNAERHGQGRQGQGRAGDRSRSGQKQ